MILILFWIIFGGLVGWIATLINQETDSRKIVAYIVLSVLGALVGGAFIHSAPDLENIQLKDFVIPVVSSVIALYIGLRSTRSSD